MKVILIPIFKIIFIMIGMSILLASCLLAQIICLFWNFKFEKYSEMVNNKSRYPIGKTYREDKNPLDTIKRWWIFDFYSNY